MSRRMSARVRARCVLAACALWAAGAVQSEAQARKQVVAAIKAAASHLGNTPAVCRKSYVHPAVIAAYMDGTFIKTGEDDTTNPPTIAALRCEEVAVLDFLRRTAPPEERDRGAA